MQDNTKIEDPSVHHQGRTAANQVGEERRSESTEESAGGEDRDDCGFLGGCDVLVSIWIYVSSAEKLLPIRHGKDAANCTRVIAIERNKF